MEPYYTHITQQEPTNHEHKQKLYTYKEPYKAYRGGGGITLHWLLFNSRCLYHHNHVLKSHPPLFHLPSTMQRTPTKPLDRLTDQHMVAWTDFDQLPPTGPWLSQRGFLVSVFTRKTSYKDNKVVNVNGLAPHYRHAVAREMHCVLSCLLLWTRLDVDNRESQFYPTSDSTSRVLDQDWRVDSIKWQVYSFVQESWKVSLDQKHGPMTINPSTAYIHTLKKVLNVWASLYVLGHVHSRGPF